MNWIDIYVNRHKIRIPMKVWESYNNATRLFQHSSTRQSNDCTFCSFKVRKVLVGVISMRAPPDFESIVRLKTSPGLLVRIIYRDLWVWWKSLRPRRAIAVGGTEAWVCMLLTDFRFGTYSIEKYRYTIGTIHCLSLSSFVFGVMCVCVWDCLSKNTEYSVAERSWLFSMAGSFDLEKYNVWFPGTWGRCMYFRYCV